MRQRPDHSSIASFISRNSSHAFVWLSLWLNLSWSVMALADKPTTISDTPATNDEDKSAASSGMETNAALNRRPLPILNLRDEQLQQQGLRFETAAPGHIATHLELPGKIIINGDHLAHVVPRVGGVVRQVNMSLGAKVTAGDVLAVIDSRELADATASYLAARERLSLATATFEREANLWRQKISATQDYLNAKNALAEARIEQRAAEQKLFALGFNAKELQRLTSDPNRVLSRYEIHAPFSGTIIEKDISLGEALEATATICVVADLSTVWADLSMFPQDLGFISIGDRVVISASGNLQADGRISYLQPIVNENTRRTFARVVLDNRTGDWRPGLFINARVALHDVEVPVMVPKAALQTINNAPVLFVKTGTGIEPRWALLGRTNETHAEIVHGLSPGESFVTSGSFILKAELEKEQMQ